MAKLVVKVYAEMTDYVEYKFSVSEHSHLDIAERILLLVDRHEKDAVICELGCGSGWLCHQMAERGFDTIGVDLSESGIKTAQSAAVKGTRFIHDSINCALSARIGLQKQCDIVISNDVIEHLYRPTDLLEAAQGLLKPGGIMICATPYHGYMKNLAIALLGKGDRHYDPLWDGGHIKFFSPTTLSNLLLGNGFMVEGFDYIGRFYGMWKSMICSASLNKK